MISLGTAYYVSEWAIRLVMLVYVPQQRSAAATRTWLLLIFLLPWPGLIVYALFGRIRVSQFRLDTLARTSAAIREAETRLLAQSALVGTVPASFTGTATLAFEAGDFLPFIGNRIELIDSYAGWIDRLIADIDGARTQVHLLFYIFADDPTGRSVADALRRASARGVSCRVLIDAVGGEGAFHRLAPDMRAAGIAVRAARPVGVFRRNTGRFDLRNHRKIAVIDARVAHTGSQNITDPGFVRDHPNEELMARIEGPVVAQVEAVFLADWFLETDERLGLRTVNGDGNAATAGTSVAQVLPSGPGYAIENARDLFISLLYAATSRVVITTPYFIPDESFLQALRAAATRGVDIHLVVSKHANQPFSQFAQRSFYEELLAFNVTIHLYRPHFLHAKHLTIDDQVAVIGTTNIDIRSFALNAEVNLVVYDPAVVATLAGIQMRYFADSDVLDAATWRRRPLVSKVAQNVARLADSLL